MIDIHTGIRFGNLTVVRVVKEDSPRKILLKCDCGCETTVFLSNLTSGHTRSCGCLSKQSKNKTHGMTNSQPFKSWQGMIYRVTNPKAEDYEKYNSMGIFEEWLHSFEKFYEHIGPQNQDGTRWSVGRIDNTVGYFPGNVRWETPHQQNRNRGKTKANTSGETGVTWRSAEVTKRPYGRAVATWYELDGTQKCKSFSEKGLGKDLAIIAAKEYRETIIQKLESQGATYGKHHGE